MSQSRPVCGYRDAQILDLAAARARRLASTFRHVATARDLGEFAAALERDARVLGDEGTPSWRRRKSSF